MPRKNGFSSCQNARSGIAMKGSPSIQSWHRQIRRCSRVTYRDAWFDVLVSRLPIASTSSLLDAHNNHASKQAHVRGGCLSISMSQVRDDLLDGQPSPCAAPLVLPPDPRGACRRPAIERYGAAHRPSMTPTSRAATPRTGLLRSENSKSFRIPCRRMAPPGGRIKTTAASMAQKV